MLPPVRTISGSSGSYQNSSSVAASAHLAGEPIFPGQAADADRDVNPNLAGKLNILLLSGHDTVAEGLTMLADALGRSLDLPRRMGEGEAAYVQRLAGVLASLGGAERREAERQLNLLLKAVRLQLVIDAFLNPTGPEAARVVALLEMANSQVRDLATRTVLTSYRQNDGADLAEALDPEAAAEAHHPEVPATAAATTAAPDEAPAAAASTGRPAPAGPAAAPSAGPAAGTGEAPALHAEAAPGQAGTLIPVPVTGGESEAPATVPATVPAEMPLVDAEELDEEPELVMFHHEVDNIFSRTSEQPLRPEPQTGHAAVLDAQSRVASPSVMDARSLQSVLESAFMKGDNADPLIQAKAAMQLLAREEVEDRPLPGRRDFVAKPFIDYTRPPPRPLQTATPLTSVLALKGWTEAEIIGLPLLPASLEAEAALAAALSPHAGPEPDIVQSGLQLRGRGIAANDMPEHKAALAAAEQQLLRNADEAAGLAGDRRIEQPTPSATPRHPADPAAATALALAQDLRQAIPYAIHPYPVVDEQEDGRRPQTGFRSRSDGDEAEGDEAPAGDDGAQHRHGQSSGEDADQPDARTASEPGDATDGSGTEMADPAFDYYQRMAGWT